MQRERVSPQRIKIKIKIGKSEAKVTNDKRLHSMYCTVKAN